MSSIVVDFNFPEVCVCRMRDYCAAIVQGYVYKFVICSFGSAAIAYSSFCFEFGVCACWGTNTLLSCK